MRIVDELSGERLSQVYFDLWCRVPDEMFIALDKPPEMAFASGFTGQRAIQSWSNRIDKLAELGFIVLAAGASGKRGHALILNPFLVIKGLRDRIGRDIYNTLLARLQEIGAEDLNELPPPPPPPPMAPLFSAIMPPPATLPSTPPFPPPGTAPIP